MSPFLLDAHGSCKKGGSLPFQFKVENVIIKFEVNSSHEQDQRGVRSHLHR